MNKLLTVAIVLAVASGLQAATVSYWELDGANWDGRDSVGTHDLVAVGGNIDSGLRADPVPNPDGSLPWQGMNDSAANPEASWFDTHDVWYSPNSGVEAEHDATFDFDPTKSFTVEGWFRALSSGTIVGARQGNPDHQFGNIWKGWSVYTTGGGTTLYFWIDGAAATGYARNITAPIEKNVMYHFAAVYDADGIAPGVGEMRLYVGQLGDPESTLRGTAIAASQWSYHRGGSLAIGGRDAGSGWNSLMLNGAIDEIRYSDQPLAPTQFLNYVPEPASLLLLSLAGAVALRRRK